MKLKYFSILITVLIFSCSNSNNDEPNIDTSPIVGVWALEGKIFQGMEDVVDECEQQNRLTFTSDGRLNIYYTDNFPCEFFNQEFDYIINDEDTNLEITENGNNNLYKFNILVLSETELRIEDYYDNGPVEEEFRTIEIYSRVIND